MTAKVADMHLKNLHVKVVNAINNSKWLIDNKNSTSKGKLLHKWTMTKPRVIPSLTDRR